MEDLLYVDIGEDFVSGFSDGLQAPEATACRHLGLFQLFVPFHRV